MQLQPGDRILTKRMKGPAAIFSEAIAWWLHSRWSHILPVVSETEAVNIIWPAPHFAEVAHFTGGDYRWKVLRPTVPFDRTAWLRTAIGLKRFDYDLESFGGFLTNDGKFQNARQINCAEGVWMCDRAAGLLAEHDGRLISPQSYDDFAAAGLFEVIYEGGAK